MAEGISMPNPAEIALPVAEELTMNGHLNEFASNSYEERKLAELERIAMDLNMIDQSYFVNSGRSFLIPVSFDADDDIETVQFENLSFEGEFVTYSTVRIGRLIGRGAIRSLCLTFDHVTLLPYFDHIPSDQLLHVPAFAVFDIDKIAG